MSQSRRKTPGTLAAAGNPRRPVWLAAGILVVITAIAFGSSFGGAMVFDDQGSISENLQIQRLWPPAELLGGMFAGNRPVVMLSLAINYAISGVATWSYHLVNLAIHIAAGLVLFGIVRRTLLSPRLTGIFGTAAVPLAAAIAGIWLVHPLQTQAVTYIIQRAESLMGLFYLLTLYCVIRGDRSPRAGAWYLAAIACCLMGVGTKQVIVTVPLIVLAYDRIFLATSWRQALSRRWWLYGGLLGCIGAMVIAVAMTPADDTAGFGLPIGPLRYALSQSGVVLHYLRLSVLPTGLSLDYAWPAAGGVGDVLLPLTAVLAMLAATAVALWRWPAAGFAALWFFLILAPTSSVMPIKDLAFEHRMYLSLAAVAAGAVCGLYALLLRRAHWAAPKALRAVMATAAAIACVLAALTYNRNLDYASGLTIWANTVQKQPDNSRAHYNYGLCLYEADRPAQAEQEYRRAIELREDFAAAHFNLCRVLAQRGQMDEAMAHCRRALELDPGMSEALNGMGNLMIARGDADAAVGYFERALERRPGLDSAHFNLATALARQGKIDLAIQHLRQCLQANPQHAKARAYLGQLLAGKPDTGRPEGRSP